MSRRGSASIARPPARRSSPRPNCYETPLSRPDSRRVTPPISCHAGTRLRSRCTRFVARKHSPCSWRRELQHEVFERLDAPPALSPEERQLLDSVRALDLPLPEGLKIEADL